MRTFFTVLCSIIIAGFIVIGCDSDNRTRNNIPTAQDTPVDGYGTVTLKVSFAPWRSGVGKIAGIESIGKITAYVYNSEGTKIAQEDMKISEGKYSGSIAVPARNNMRVVLVFYDLSEGTVRYIGEDSDVDVPPGGQTTAVIVEYYMGTSVTAPDSVEVDTDYTVSWMARPYADSYQLHEATIIDFSDVVLKYTGSNDSTVINNSVIDTYYYRARVYTFYGYGPWHSTGMDSTVVGAKGTIDVGGDVPPDEPVEGKIVFSSDRNGYTEIYVMDADGSNLQKLTESVGTSAINSDPVWSPDGTKIAFQSTLEGSNDIYVMNADGTNQIRITSDAATDAHPTWSPDGTDIAFHSNRDGNYQIYITRAIALNRPINISQNAYNDILPAWSPDGKSIAFCSDRDRNNEIYIMSPDGTDQTNISKTAGSDFEPAWSPDGSLIAFHSNRDGNVEVYIINGQGSQFNISKNAADDSKPTWSPDGSYMAFHSNRDKNSEIYIMGVTGLHQINITNNSANDHCPDWLWGE